MNEPILDLFDSKYLKLLDLGDFPQGSQPALIIKRNNPEALHFLVL